MESDELTMDDAGPAAERLPAVKEEAETQPPTPSEISSEPPSMQEGAPPSSEAPGRFPDADTPVQSGREIRTEDLVKIYSKRRVVDGVSIVVRQGEIVGLLGPNGAGKTTTFYMIVGLIRPNRGRIFIDNKNISRKPMYKRARMGIGYLPQEPSIFRKLSVGDNIMSILEHQRMSAKDRRRRMKQLLEELHVAHLEKNMSYTLSGGERRRVEIARALAIHPDFILLDEPFAGVDPIAVEDIQSIVHELRSKGYGVLITDHNVRETMRITDRAYIMAEGKILISGTARELAVNPEARRIYLGRNFRLD
ncbi:MAG: LPS export ABC transporter ATP-binding protein [Chitinispirillaceae bacterium]|nr:LPS export ABC transporter ATP-binding protein [Chitinispirillaceae bacterium]